MARLLVLHVGYAVKASYYDDWLEAFRAAPGLGVTALNLFTRPKPQDVARAAREADAVVMLHSCAADTLDYARPVTSALNERKGPLVVFMGNEFNMPWLPFADRRAWLKDAAVDLIATQLLAETGRWLYAEAGGRVISVPHGLNPAAFQPRTPWRARGRDIGTRSFAYPVYLGDSLRNDLFREVGVRAPALGLSVDISTTQRLDRAGWAAFLDDCRFTVATEAGASHLERDDALAFAIQSFLNERRKGVAIRPNSAIRGLARRLPWGLREGMLKALARVGVRHEAIEDDPELRAAVIARFFAGRPAPPHHGGCISSRHFDAMGTGTAQILVEGRYNDLITAGEHYIPVRADFADLGEVLQRLRDPDYGADVAARARAHALERHTLAHRITALMGELTLR
jgi:hypothetical protein